MPYNMSGVDDAANLGQIITGFNDLTGGFFGVGICFGLFFIASILLLRKSPPAEAITASSLLTTIASMALWAAGLIPIYWIIIYSFIFAFAVVGLYITNKQT